MIERLPKCLHTCWHCCNAVIREDYSKFMRKITFCGCWEINGVSEPRKRNDCTVFQEDEIRTRRDFWGKWKDNTYVQADMG